MVTWRGGERSMEMGGGNGFRAFRGNLLKIAKGHLRFGRFITRPLVKGGLGSWVGPRHGGFNSGTKSLIPCMLTSI